MSDGYRLVDMLRKNQILSTEAFKKLLMSNDQSVSEYLYKNAREVCDNYYGKKVFIRGLIEFTNYCRNNCYYCGIRRENQNIERYRLRTEEILSCAEEGYRLGFRTIVLQGGEDGFYTRHRLGEIIKKIKKDHPDCAVTLSFGEWEAQDYEYWFECGADRYLLRHETANDKHYGILHPNEMKLSHRKACLEHLKETGYQVGAGFMVGSPGQTLDFLIEDLLYLKNFQPHMIGIGPFIPQKDTPFGREECGSLSMTLKLLAILRLMLPKVLLPSTTALGTIHPEGRAMGILSGANVIMPNLSPMSVRKKYLLYDNKIYTGDESAQCKINLEEHLRSIGYELCVDRGDSLM